MTVLVIDTALDACTVGLFSPDGQTVWAQTQRMPRGQEAALGGMAQSALSDTDLRQLSLIAVTLGPGSFTGLRIGLSFAKGLAAGAGVPMAGFNTLEALAASHDLRSRRRIVAMEGGRGVAYLQSFGGPDRTTPLALRMDDAEAIRAYISAVGETDAITGPAANWLSGFAPSTEVIPADVPTAEALGWLALTAQLPYDTTPVYMREADAKPSTRPQLSF